MTRLALVACLAALAIPATAITQEQAAPAPQAKAAPAAKSNPNKLECRDTKAVGSRVRARRCRTQDQANQDNEDVQRLNERTRGMVQQNIVPLGGGPSGGSTGGRPAPSVGP